MSLYLHLTFADLFPRVCNGVKLRMDCKIKYHNSLADHMTFNILWYYMAVSHKDWELPNSRIWLAEIDIENSLDFPI